MSKKVFRGTVVIVLVGILAKVASFIEEAILAAYLGTTFQSDAYYMVWSIQSVVYPMLSIGIWKVFLPLYKSHVSKNENDSAFDLTNKSLSFFTLVSIVVVVLMVIFAPVVVSVVAPGFKGETRELCIKLTRISAPMYVFIIASAVYASVLQCHNKFFGSQIREIVSHFPPIIAAIFFYKIFGIEAMAVSLVVAGLVRLLIELPFVDWGYRYKVDLRFKCKEFKLMLKRLPSALISAGVVQLNTLVDKMMASTLPTGTISGLNYGHKLMNVFSGLLSSAIATAMYPQMIELIALEKKEELGNLVVRIINIFSILMIPVTVACVLFRVELVSAVFERGAFDSNSTDLTSSVFALYCLGLFFIACNTVISNIFYGYGDTRREMLISIAFVGTNVLLNVVLVNVWGVNGLALATSLSAILSFFIRLGAVKRYVCLQLKRLMLTGMKVLVVSLVSCIIPRIVFWCVPINKYIVIIVSATIGVCIYIVGVMAWKVPEVYDLFKLFKKKKRL